MFFTGRFAQAYPDLVRSCHERGHQLGTHGWAHGGLEEDEDFRTAGYEQQRDWIRRATEAVEQAAGVRPVIFRAPNLWISETTLRVLEEEGYLYDSSVPARRFDLGFGRVHYLKYFWAPTAPYRPCATDLGRPGASLITEVPPSACLFPINLATLRVLGLPLLGKMITWITRESTDLVFYCHPSEFVYAKDQVVSQIHVKVESNGHGPDKPVPRRRLYWNICLSVTSLRLHIMHASLPQLDLSRPARTKSRELLKTTILLQQEERHEGTHLSAIAACLLLASIVGCRAAGKYTKLRTRRLKQPGSR